MEIKQYFLDKIIPIIITAVLSFASGCGLKHIEINDLRKEIQDLKIQMPEMPVTVVDPATKNQLYIGKPIPRSTHYEFPIILNDGQGIYRIDQYSFRDQFKGILIIKKQEVLPKE